MSSLQQRAKTRNGTKHQQFPSKVEVSLTKLVIMIKVAYNEW